MVMVIKLIIFSQNKYYQYSEVKLNNHDISQFNLIFLKLFIYIILFC